MKYRICEKGLKNKSLTAEQKERNRENRRFAREQSMLEKNSDHVIRGEFVTSEQGDEKLSKCKSAGHEK